MDKMTKKIMGAFIAIIVVAAAILAVYFTMNRQAEKEAQEDILPTTEAGKILAKDLELKYPETPTEVLKLYWRINRCMYNETLSDSDFEKMLKQLRMLYDEEFLADEKNSFDTMLKNFKEEKETYNENNQIISACVIQENDTIQVKKLENRECATIITSTFVKASGKSKEKSAKTYEEFMCRKDDKGKWKILGWQQTTADQAQKVGVK